MHEFIYFYNSYENRNLPEEERGFAKLTLATTKEQEAITDMLISSSMKVGKNTVVSMGQKNFEIAKRHVKEIVNVKDPLTDEIYDSITITEVYDKPQLKELYNEICNAMTDVNTLKEGIKKN